MKKFAVKFLREFEVEVVAENSASAQTIASNILAQFPKDSCKLLSIIAEGVDVEVLAEIGGETGRKPPPPKGPPNMGGSPATPVIRLPVLADQIAAAA